MGHIEKTEAELQSIKRMKERLIEMCNAEVNKGCEAIDSKELGEVIDMIKDLAEADKACWSALYYKKVVEAMEKSEEEEETMQKMGYRMGMTSSGMRYSQGSNSSNGNQGYNPNRSMTTGRYTSGYGDGRMGMTMGDESQMPYIMAYTDEMMGYTPSGMGNRSQSGSRMGYWGDRMGYEEQMTPHERLNRTIETMRKMWNDADPEMKKKMKADLQNLINDLKI